MAQLYKLLSSTFSHFSSSSSSSSSATLFLSPLLFFSLSLTENKTMSEDDEWVTMASTNDLLVVELLLRLKRPLPDNRVARVLNVDWTVRQKRSSFKPVMTRASPTTPLTWSGATSLSGGGGVAADGFEDSSLIVKMSDGARSKIAGKNGVTTTMKRTRKKKTLVELREEESLLLKERRSLKDALATLRLTVEKQRAVNGNLKKMKLDLQSQQTIETVAMPAMNFNQPQPQIVRSICDTMPIGAAALGCNSIDASFQFTLPNIACKLQEIGTLGTVRLLPDLNMPFQEDSGSEVIYGMS